MWHDSAAGNSFFFNIIVLTILLNVKSTIWLLKRFKQMGICGCKIGLYGGCIKTFKSNSLNIYWVANMYVIERWRDEKPCLFCWSILAAFSQFLVEVSLNVDSKNSNWWYCPAIKAHNKCCPSNSSIHLTLSYCVSTRLLFVQPDRPLTWISFIHSYRKGSVFDWWWPVIHSSKLVRFYYDLRDNCEWIHAPLDFFH